MTHQQRNYTGSGGPADPLGRCQPGPQVTRLEAWPVGIGLWRLVATVSEAGRWWYYWLVDGELHAVTRTPTITIATPAANVELIVSRTGRWDLLRQDRGPRPRAWTIEWTRSEDDVNAYRVEVAVGNPAGEWETWELIAATGAWSYRRLTGELDDLETYQFRVVPIELGNDGTPAEWPARRCVRNPEGPDFEVSFESGTGLVTVAEP